MSCEQVVHVVYNRFEPNPTDLLVTWLLLFVVPSIPACYMSHNSQINITPSAVVAKLTYSYAVFYGALIISIILYRISPFHPLASFPGPLLAKVSQFWAMTISSRGKRHEHIKKLHDKYGLHVRIGESLLSNDCS